ncbi:monovalent cation:proton antiporter-2 (CPA2) family protein [Acinetobacter pittii]|jgi:glutathione-regulated potassium-efflux system protein KefB|uniref:monovalent cation:proton antiporter-2 (CPA2) family protein n=1 Tax=Acinetobacter TaxID=469 RepID=UPI00083FC944|nr:monovalent cation:proton antiporter-2 (CPA2) family protein [Acinetobacter pittii]MCE5999439.1 monovalent cation:proton antiporter-2 (CPA2) family protein [Acinetobacter pittii]MCE6626944.1 monovalent cation:proton antiporter-2 (CPA2) family protein [Acinetobacter pittii]MDP7846065.1 monovalent cation:proton antiporter-2 (CPA2) family protein [Acinetobacter pittii]MDP7871652.1 monovalent cation:proton antiporter-2 (CPA2) family protein [Acinetobacter pittii]ODL93206.1 potassium transporter 
MSFLLQATIFLGASLILVPLGKRLGIATVLGYLFTGILLGPSVLNIAHDPEAIMELAEFGVILLMFLIGLELRPQRLWEMRDSIFVMGSLQVLTSGAILMLIVLLLFQQQLSVSFVIGFALALSSTAFVLQLLTEKQQLNTTYGQQSFSILLFQDIAAIPLLAIIPLLAGTESTHHGVAYFAAIIATFTGLFMFSRYVMRPFFRFVAKSGATELITAVGLFIILAVVLLMDTLGISTTLGAFLTGVLLADSEFRHEVEASIAPFKGLLLGLFFMTVGMTTQLSLLIEMPLLIIGGAVGLLLIKTLILTAIARYKKYSWNNSLLLGTCLAQGGEFAFVILSLAKSEKVLTQAILEPVTLIVTLSMVLTPVIYWIMATQVIPLFNKERPPEYDEIPQQDNPIIIAGFGRFGQIIARIARLQHLGFTAIDNNLHQVDFVRRYGGKLYYGDVTQPDLLRSAGIEKAKVFILAIDDVEDSMNVARHLRLNYPNLKLLVRARDRHHVHLLRDLGVEYIWRETYLSSLGMAYRALRELGISDEQAYNNIEIFRDYDEKLLIQQQSIYTDEQKIFETHRNALAELEHLFESDAQQQATSKHDVNLKRHLQPNRIDITRDHLE